MACYTLDELPTHIRSEIEEDPLFYVLEGGPDGTFAHSRFHDQYGIWLPAASNYAAQLCEQRGIVW